jgi:hypothetical protein
MPTDDNQSKISDNNISDSTPLNFNINLEANKEIESPIFSPNSQIEQNGWDISSFNMQWEETQTGEWSHRLFFSDDETLINSNSSWENQDGVNINELMENKWAQSSQDPFLEVAHEEPLPQTDSLENNEQVSLDTPLQEPLPQTDSLENNEQVSLDVPSQEPLPQTDSLENNEQVSLDVPSQEPLPQTDSLENNEQVSLDIPQQELIPQTDSLENNEQVSLDTPLQEPLPQTDIYNEISTYTPNLDAVQQTVQQLEEAKEQWIGQISSNALDEIPVIQSFSSRILIDDKNENPWSETLDLDEILNEPQVEIPSIKEDFPIVENNLAPLQWDFITDQEKVINPNWEIPSFDDIDIKKDKPQIIFPDNVSVVPNPLDINSPKGNLMETIKNYLGKFMWNKKDSSLGTLSWEETKNIVGGNGIASLIANKKHLLLGAWAGWVSLILLFFVIKTMFPVEMSEIKAETENTYQWSETMESSFPEHNAGLAEPEIPLEEIEQEQDTSEFGQAENIESNFGENTSNLENENTQETQQTSSENTVLESLDPFESIDTIQTDSDLEKTATIDSLKEFAYKWQYYLDLWKVNGIKDMIKYWIFLTGKANHLIDKIENWEILDISSLDSDLAQFSLYLQKLQNLDGNSDTQEKNSWGFSQESDFSTKNWSSTETKLPMTFQ